MTELMWGVLGVLAGAIPFWLGLFIGRRTASQRRVDQILRREMRGADIDAVARAAGVMPSPITGMGSDLVGTLEGADRLREALKTLGTPMDPDWPSETRSDVDRRPDGGAQS